MHNHLSKILIALVFVIISGCKDKKDNDNINKLTQEEKDAGWELLFDGKTLNGWKILGRSKDEKPSQWIVENGTIKKVKDEDVIPNADAEQINGDLMTIETFDNFELYFEWKLTAGGNCGIKYNVSEEFSMKYGSSHHALGWEYQELDDMNKKYQGEYKLKPSQYTASLYDMIPAKNAPLKPVGKFNQSRIIINGNHGEHWLNGVKVVEFEFGTEEFQRLFEKSKYHKYPGFEKKRKGHIVITDHHDNSWHRNIKIRRIIQN